MSPEMFNPYDPKYKKVEDLPKEMQPKFRNYKDGFVTEAAEEEYKEAELVIRLAKELKEAGVDVKEFMRANRTKRMREIGEAIKNDYTETDVLRERAIKEESSEPTPIDILHEEANKMHEEKYPELAYIKKIKSNPEDLTGFPKRIWGNKKFALEAVKLNRKALRKVGREAYDYEVIMEAIRHDGLALEYTPESYKDDKDVVLEAIKQNPKAIKFASKAIKQAIANVMNM